MMMMMMMIRFEDDWKKMLWGNEMAGFLCPVIIRKQFRTFKYMAYDERLFQIYNKGGKNWVLEARFLWFGGRVFFC